MPDGAVGAVRHPGARRLHRLPLAQPLLRPRFPPPAEAALPAAARAAPAGDADVHAQAGLHPVPGRLRGAVPPPDQPAAQGGVDGVRREGGEVAARSDERRGREHGGVRGEVRGGGDRGERRDSGAGDSGAGGVQRPGGALEPVPLRFGVQRQVGAGGRVR